MKLTLGLYFLKFYLGPINFVEDIDFKATTIRFF